MNSVKNLLIASLLAVLLVGNAMSAPSEVGSLKQQQMRQKLQRLQAELDALERDVSSSASSTAAESAADDEPAAVDSRDVNPVAGFARRSPAARPAGIEKKGVFYDAPVDLKQRQIGWQPLKKRVVGWQPLKKRNELPMDADDVEEQLIQLTPPHARQLKAELLAAVETHLLEDLQAARQFGIEPSSILRDLRAKNRRRQPQM